MSLRPMVTRAVSTAIRLLLRMTDPLIQRGLDRLAVAAMAVSSPWQPSPPVKG
ncbi:hypothetical protein [Streptomyces sp. NPDC001811]